MTFPTRQGSADFQRTLAAMLQVIAEVELNITTHDEATEKFDILLAPLHNANVTVADFMGPTSAVIRDLVSLLRVHAPEVDVIAELQQTVLRVAEVAEGHRG